MREYSVIYSHALCRNLSTAMLPTNQCTDRREGTSTSNVEYLSKSQRQTPSGLGVVTP